MTAQVMIRHSYVKNAFKKATMIAIDLVYSQGIMDGGKPFVDVEISSL